MNFCENIFQFFLANVPNFLWVFRLFAKNPLKLCDLNLLLLRGLLYFYGGILLHLNLFNNLFFLFSRVNENDLGTVVWGLQSILAD